MNEHSLSSTKPCPVCNDTGCHLATRIHPPMTIEKTPVSLLLGRTYVFDFPGKREHGWRYKLLPPTGTAFHVNSGQDLVIYVGMEHADRGKVFASQLLDWHYRFKLEELPAPVEVPEAPPPEPDPGIVLDYTSSGYGEGK